MPTGKRARLIAGGTGTLAEQLARILTAARDDRPRSELADRAGVTPHTLREVELNRRGDGTPNNPTLKRVEAIADVYGVDLELVARRR